MVGRRHRARARRARSRGLRPGRAARRALPFAGGLLNRGVGMISRRAFLIATGSMAGLSRGLPPVQAQSFPNGLVRIIVPFPPGGGTDVLGRLLSSELQVLWGQSVILD